MCSDVSVAGSRLEWLAEDWDRALAVVAHPDDMEYGAASAIAKWTAAGKQDCLVLDRCLAEHAGDRGAALGEYQRLRKPNAEAIATRLQKLLS